MLAFTYDAASRDERYMRIALQIAETGRGQTSPNPLVGCVLVKEGIVVGQGAHLRAGSPHAEVHALRMAGHAAEGATAYVTLEPCSHHGRTPPCADALVEAGVRRVVIASLDPNPKVSGQGVAKLREAGIEVTSGLLATEAQRQNEAYLTWMIHRRPFIVWKCAATLDGFTATENGHSQFVTGPEARVSVQHLRQQVSAISVGVGTVSADNPRLTVHDQDGHQPVRVIFDSRLRISSDARLLHEPGRTILYCTQAASMEAKARLSDLENVEYIEVPPDKEGHVSIPDALRDVAERGLDSVLLEGGWRLAGSFARQRFIDKVLYYIAPKLLGGGQPSLGGLYPKSMDEAIRLGNVNVEQVGEDICVTGYPTYKS